MQDASASVTRNRSTPHWTLVQFTPRGATCSNWLTYVGKPTPTRDAQLVQGVTSRLKLFWGAAPPQIAKIVQHFEQVTG